MDSVVSVLSWIWYNFFDRAAMFMMVLVFIGQLLTKRPFLESLMGALKAYIGYIVYQTATGGLYTTFQPIMMGLRQVLGMNIIVNDDSLGAGTLTAILESFGRTTSLQMASMAAGFGIAIILVLMKKYTKCRSLIIQAHILSGQAIDMVPILLVMFPVMGGLINDSGVGAWMMNSLLGWAKGFNVVVLIIISTVVIWIINSILVNSQSAIITVSTVALCAMAGELGVNPVLFVMPSILVYSLRHVLGMQLDLYVVNGYGYWDQKDTIVPGLISSIPWMALIIIGSMILVPLAGL